jgi:hypothetical protein
MQPRKFTREKKQGADTICIPRSMNTRRERTHQYTKYCLASLIPQIYTPVLTGNFDKQRARAYLFYNKRMLNLAIVFEFASVFPSLKQSSFRTSNSRFYSVEGGLPRSFDRSSSLIWTGDDSRHTPFMPMTRVIYLLWPAKHSCVGQRSKNFF